MVIQHNGFILAESLHSLQVVVFSDLQYALNDCVIVLWGWFIL